MESQIVRVEEQNGALARPPEDIGISIEVMLARVEKIREVRTRVMKHGVHYGKIPGVDKESLLKPGAEILCMTFQLGPEFTIDERWDGDHLEVVVTCTLLHVPTGRKLGSGVGSCSTRESKYAYRKGERVCPQCDAAAIIKGKKNFGGGWLCWQKKGGCGAKFKDDDEQIVGQNVGRVANPDLPDVYNTVRKIGCKRAHVAATLFVTGASELFTQDVEDQATGQRGQRNGAPAGGNGTSSGNGYEDGHDDDHGGSETFVALCDDMMDAHTTEQLEALVPALKRAREQKTITPPEYQQLRDAYANRKAELDAKGGDDIPF